jgi:hypothetical protein
MKRTLIIFTGMIGFIFLTISPSAFAQDKVITIELPESGHLLVFPMSAAEIAASKAAEARQASEKKPLRHKPNPKLKAGEMADGHVVYFPMTARDVAAERTEKARKAKLKRDRPAKPKKNYVAFELPESGNVILFPATGSTVSEDPDAYTAGKSEDNRRN